MREWLQLGVTGCVPAIPSYSLATLDYLSSSCLFSGNCCVGESLRWSDVHSCRWVKWKWLVSRLSAPNYCSQWYKDTQNVFPTLKAAPWHSGPLLFLKWKIYPRPTLFYLPIINIKYSIQNKNIRRISEQLNYVQQLTWRFGSLLEPKSWKKTHPNPRPNHWSFGPI